MLSAPGTAKVTTSGGAHGAVAGIIHGGVRNNYYQSPKGASPQVKLRCALNYLGSGQATTARKLLDEVVTEVSGDPEIWFRWLLAFFSGRTIWELRCEDREKLRSARVAIGGCTGDAQWTAASEVILLMADVAESHGAEGADMTTALHGLDRLDAAVRQDILRHLERVLQGSIKDHVWQRDVAQAREGQVAGDRKERAWMFFEPDPEPPRTRPVHPDETSAWHLAVIAGMTVAVVVAVGFLGSLVLRRGDADGLAAILISLAGSVVAVQSRAQWRFLAEGQRAQDREAREHRSAGWDAPHSFAGWIGWYYTRYAASLAPGAAERADWEGAAYAPIGRLRNEVIEVYRTARVNPGALRWLIRFQVRELARDWEDGTLAERRNRWHVPTAVRAGTVTGAAVAVAALGWAALSAARADTLVAIGAFVAALISGWLAADLGVRASAESRRVSAEESDRARREQSYDQEWNRWRRVLADRPTDLEIADWLECDRRLLLDRAMTANKLRWSDVRAYASLETRGRGSVSARATNGPWRYSRYQVLIFLLTADGVRQITVGLDLRRATCHDWERTNYRYGAVAAAWVTLADDGTRVFRLYLVDGNLIQVGVTEAGIAGDGEDGDILADAAEDTTGLRNTMFVLEGVAAEGRRWWGGPAYRRGS